MPPTLEYLPPKPSDGMLPAIAMVVGLISGPVGFAAVAFAERRPWFYITFDIVSPTTYLILCGVLGAALVLAIVTRFGFARTRRGRSFAGIGIAAPIVWAAAFVAFILIAISTLG
jgi:hypothetical protein